MQVLIRGLELKSGISVHSVCTTLVQHGFTAYDDVDYGFFDDEDYFIVQDDALTDADWLRLIIDLNKVSDRLVTTIFLELEYIPMDFINDVQDLGQLIQDKDFLTDIWINNQAVDSYIAEGYIAEVNLSIWTLQDFLIIYHLIKEKIHA